MENKSVKLATDFVVTNAANFVNADPTKTLMEVILDGKGTKDVFSFETGVKYYKITPYLSDAAVDVSNGLLSGGTGSGSTTIVDVSLGSSLLKIFETYTKGAIDKKVVGLLAKKGSDNSELPLSEFILAMKGKALHAKNENLIWQSTAGATTNIGAGVLQQCIDASGTSLTVAYAATAFSGLTDASILKIVNAFPAKVAASLPELIDQTTILAMSPGQFQAYARAQYGLNGTILNTNLKTGEVMTELQIPGTNVTAWSCVGLNGSNQMVLSRPENIIVAYDLESEDEEMNLLYNPFDFRHELSAQYKLGAKIVNTAKVITCYNLT